MALPHSHATTKHQNNRNRALSAKHPKLRSVIGRRVQNVSHAESSRNAVSSLSAILGSLLYLKVKRTRKFYAPTSRARQSSGICKSDCQKARSTCLSNA